MNLQKKEKKNDTLNSLATSLRPPPIVPNNQEFAQLYKNYVNFISANCFPKSNSGLVRAYIVGFESKFSAHLQLWLEQQAPNNLNVINWSFNVKQLHNNLQVLRKKIKLSLSPVYVSSC